MLSLKPFFKKADSHNPIIFNLFLWLSAFYAFLFFFSEDGVPKKIDYIYTSCFVVTIIPPVLINFYVLIPFFLRKEKYILFTALFIVNLLVFTEVNKWFFNFFIDRIFVNYFFVSYFSNTGLFILFSVFLIITLLIKLAENWVRLNRQKNQILAIENLEIQNQLSSLKSQINPHFLFNSLNVLYSLSLEKKEETSSAILHLSDILRYVLYEANDKKITLKKEVELIQKYLDFQKYRSQKNANVSFHVDIQNDDAQIHPMLLLPLIENSFKHGIKNDIENTFVTIEMIQKKKEFLFYIENNFSKNELISDTEYSGLGLKNIRQNLELIYPNHYSFEVMKKENRFSVAIKITDL